MFYHPLPDAWFYAACSTRSILWARLTPRSASLHMGLQLFRLLCRLKNVPPNETTLGQMSHSSCTSVPVSFCTKSERRAFFVPVYQWSFARLSCFVIQTPSIVITLDETCCKIAFISTNDQRPSINREPTYFQIPNQKIIPASGQFRSKI